MSMKYYKVTEDNDLFKNVNLSELSRRMNLNYSHLSRIKNGHETVSERKYSQLKDEINKLN